MSVCAKKTNRLRSRLPERNGRANVPGMPSILKRTPRVLVIQETCVLPGRDKLRGIFNYIRLYGPWHLHLIQSRAGEQEIRSLADWNEYDGIIADQMAFELADILKQTRKPIVLMAHPPPALQARPPFAKLSCVFEDSARIGCAGAEYFLTRGYKHFAYVGEPHDRSWSAARGTAFQRRVADAGYTCAVYPSPTDAKDWRTGRKPLLRWLKALPKPVALLAAMDARAHQVIDACAEADLRVPHDAAVLGIDNDELLCSGSIPSLSSIQRDTQTCGFLAAQLLDRRMRKSDRKKQVFTYGVDRIVTRDSTRADIAPADPVALKAREFIRVNAGERIGVPDVVRHLNVSRRLIEIRFRAAFGRSLLEEIRDARLARVGHLLAETALTLSEICERCNYQTDMHLRRLFKTRFGCTMRDYRRRACFSGTHQRPPDDEADVPT